MTLNIDIITGYHAHVYFTAGEPSADLAKNLRDQAAQKFGDTIVLGTWRDHTVGPHTTGSYKIGFTADQFKDIVPWLTLNGVGLSILVHPETGDDLKDHRDYPLWIGPQQDINFSFFDKVA